METTKTTDQAPERWTPEGIKWLREFIGDSLTQFAERCGVERKATVAEWESGRRKPSGSTKKLFDYIAADVGFTEAKRRAMAEKSQEDPMS